MATHAAHGHGCWHSEAGRVNAVLQRLHAVNRIEDDEGKLVQMSVVHNQQPQLPRICTWRMRTCLAEPLRVALTNLITEI